MEAKIVFTNAVNRLKKYSEYKYNKSHELSKILKDSTIIDTDGEEELFDATVDITCCVLPNLSKETIKNYLGWYIYEIDEKSFPTSIEYDNESKVITNDPGSLFDFFKDL